MSIDQLQTMQVIRGKRTQLGPDEGGHQGLFHAAPGRPRKADKVSLSEIINEVKGISQYLLHRHPATDYKR